MEKGLKGPCIVAWDPMWSQLKGACNVAWDPMGSQLHCLDGGFLARGWCTGAHQGVWPDSQPAVLAITALGPNARHGGCLNYYSITLVPNTCDKIWANSEVI